MFSSLKREIALRSLDGKMSRLFDSARQQEEAGIKPGSPVYSQLYAEASKLVIDASGELMIPTLDLRYPSLVGLKAMTVPVAGPAGKAVTGIIGACIGLPVLFFVAGFLVHVFQAGVRL